MPDVSLPTVQGMGVDEKQEALARVAMQSKEHLLRWLTASGRRWLVFDTKDLVESLPWPEGVRLFIQIVSGYREQRGTKGEALEIEELEAMLQQFTSEHIEMLKKKILEKKKDLS